MLSSILPAILEENDFEAVWSDNWWKKLKAGAGIYGVFWDREKHNGLGDVAIKKIDPLNLFWEPGITDLQKSRNLFYVQLEDNDVLESTYPVLVGKLGAKEFQAAKYLYDDSVDSSDKSVVIDWYYHKQVDGRKTLQYVKFVGETVLYATENDEELAARGLYDHGCYPFVADVMFPEEGTPLGFGYIDLCKDAQRQIDLMNTSIVSNCLAVATPRWLVRGDGGINEAEYADLTKTFVHVQGSLDEQAIRPIQAAMLNSNYIAILQNKIEEMKQTSGNRDVNNGGIHAGVTAASAIAAMQEQSGKLSRDQIKNSYRCFRKINYLLVELLRQFYDVPRQFRIAGDGMRFVTYSNEGLLPAGQEAEMGVQPGPRTPVFDIQVESAKQSAYSRLSNNELALQLFTQGFFNPQLAEQVLPCLQMMDFKGREELIRNAARNLEQLRQAQQAQLEAQTMAPDAGKRAVVTRGVPVKQRTSLVERAREQARLSTQPR